MTRIGLRGRFPIVTRRVAIALVLLIATNSSFGQDGASLRQAFLNDAPQAWEEYRNWASGLQGSWTESSAYKYVTPASEGTFQRKYEIKQRKGYCLFVEQNFIDDGKPATKGICRVVNPRYGFELRRNGPEAAWVVAKYAQGLTFSGILAPVNFVGMVMAYPLMTGGPPVKVDYPSLEPGFKLLNVTPVVRKGRTLAKVEFEFQPKNKEQSLRGGWVLYDPGWHWVQHECLLFVERTGNSGLDIIKGTNAASFEYDERKPGFPIIKRMVTRFERPAKSYTADFTLEFQLHEAESPERDFALSAFAFPDPITEPQIKGGVRWYIWFAIAGFGFLAIAYMLRRGLPWRARNKDELPKSVRKK
jgi:hypothetical protein